MLLARAEGQAPSTIASHLRCARQTVDQALDAFAERGVDCLRPGSHVPVSVAPVLTAEKREHLQAILPQSPRNFGKAQSHWTLKLLATVCHEHGLSARPLSPPTLLDAVGRLGARWQRAKHWLVSPDPAYARKKNRRDRLIRLAEQQTDSALGCEEEVWWSREAPPQMHPWCEEAPVHLVETQVAAKDPAAKAIACYGRSLPQRHQRLLRFVCGRPGSAVPCLFLAWLTTYFAAQGKRALVLIWDNASWPISQAVRQWIRSHKRTVQQGGGWRVILCRLPSKSPWLNPMDPKWVHGKRAVSDPVRTLAVAELMQRMCAYYNCAMEDIIVQAGC
jgi:hypothetical protein